jgi:hypothetical protein
VGVVLGGLFGGWVGAGGIHTLTCFDVGYRFDSDALMVGLFGKQIVKD